MTQSQAGALVELASRCEAASGPDRELDAEIGAAAGIMDFNGRDGVLGTPFYRVTDDGLRIQFCTRLDDGSEHRIASREPRLFTASLDAAMSLIPEGWSWGITAETERKLSSRSPFSASVRRYWTSFDKDFFCRAATPALALCAAALRARAASEGNPHV